MAHAPTGIVQGIDPPNDGFEKVPRFEPRIAVFSGFEELL
jgi:hypothetical protein